MSATRAPRLPSIALALVAGAIAVAPRAAHAQTNTAESLAEAARLYDDLQVERAVVLLRQVISPSSPFEVSRGQRVQAYTYLGASLAILGMRDSAVTYFRAALERDPFVDLDPTRFTQRERDAFAEARKRTLTVGARPVPTLVFEPRTGAVPVIAVSTQSAIVRVSIERTDDSSAVTLFERESDGVRELSWNGIMADGSVARAGRYSIVVRGATAVASDSARVPFDLSHQHEPLEALTPPLTAEQLLTERYPASVAASAVVRGIALATVSLAIPTFGPRRLAEEGRPLSRGVAAASIAVGVTGYLYRRSHPENREAIAENRRRRAELDARNAAIAERNAATLAGLRIVVVPSGATP